jgi:RNA-directed DNA polymerase
VNKRRLFLSTEFHPKSGKHEANKDLNCTDLNKIKNPKKLCIVDNRVFNSSNENMALPKDNFADYVLRQEKNFNDLDHSEFSKIFDIIYRIIIDHSS